MVKEIIKKGKCVCTCEPRGDFGLEGFDRGDSYKYVSYKDSAGNLLFAVQPPECENYWEKCTERVFNRYFKIIADK